MDSKEKKSESSPLLVGITGGIGSGKTSLANLFRQAGYSVYDADKRARSLQNEDASLRQAITKLMGSKAYLPSGELNRPWLANIVFNRPELLLQLNETVHPVVKRDFLRWAAERQEANILFLESAILFESGFWTLFHKIINVTADKDLRIQRVMKRDGITRQQVMERIERQLPEEERNARSHIIISTNQGLPSPEELKKLLAELGNSV